MVRAEAVLVLFFTTYMAAGMTCLIDFDEFRRRLRQPRGILVALCCQYLLLPLSAVTISYLFFLPKVYSVALVILASCPGGLVSNFVCFVSGADINLSVAATTASTLLSAVFLPLNTFLYVKCIVDRKAHIRIGWLSLVVTLLFYFFGMAVGSLVAVKDYLRQRCQNIMVSTSSLFLVIYALTLIVRSLMDTDHGLAAVPVRVVFAQIVLSLFGFAMGGLLCWFVFAMDLAKCLAVAFETSAQNVGVTMVILQLSLSDKAERNKAMTVPIFYSLLSFVLFLGLALTLFYYQVLPQHAADAGGAGGDKALKFADLIQAWREFNRGLRGGKGKGKGKAKAGKHKEAMDQVAAASVDILDEDDGDGDGKEVPTQMAHAVQLAS